MRGAHERPPVRRGRAKRQRRGEGGENQAHSTNVNTSGAAVTSPARRPPCARKIRHYFAPKKLHVLDGHERYEAMLAYQAELVAKHAPPTYSSANYGLACLTSLDDPALATAPRHRVLRGAGSRAAAFAAL
ncbi:MAG TPA: DUF1015 family protein, partial [Longimicrobium sp.]|nr:DUF1015 family protein [Longimicrobium sp.]